MRAIAVSLHNINFTYLRYIMTYVIPPQPDGFKRTLGLKLVFLSIFHLQCLCISSTSQVSMAFVFRVGTIK